MLARTFLQKRNIPPLLSTTLPPTAVVAVFTGLGVAAAVTYSPSIAAVAATTGTVGAFLGNIIGGNLLTRSCAPRRITIATVTLWILATVSLVLTLTLHQPLILLYLLSFSLGVLWGTNNIANRHIIAHWNAIWIRYNGPLGRIGGTFGAIIGTIAGTTGNLWMLIPMAIFLLASPSLLPTHITHQLMNPHPTSDVRIVEPPTAWNRSVVTQNFLLAALGYGTVVIQVALISATAGPAWVGAGMAVYTVAALTAPLLAIRLPHKFHYPLQSKLILAGIANLAWILTLPLPIVGALTARYVSGTLLFIAEGTADVEAATHHNAHSAITGRSAGGICAGLLATWLLTVTPNVATLGMILAVLAFLPALAIPLYQRDRTHPLSVPFEPIEPLPDTTE